VADIDLAACRACEGGPAYVFFAQPPGCRPRDKFIAYGFAYIVVLTHRVKLIALYLKAQDQLYYEPLLFPLTKRTTEVHSYIKTCKLEYSIQSYHT
jgi:hypothetical protein